MQVLCCIYVWQVLGLVWSWMLLLNWCFRESPVSALSPMQRCRCKVAVQPLCQSLFALIPWWLMVTSLVLMTVLFSLRSRVFCSMFHRRVTYRSPCLFIWSLVSCTYFSAFCLKDLKWNCLQSRRCWFLYPEGGSQKATLVVFAGISSPQTRNP